MSRKEFILSEIETLLPAGEFSARAPSNIALIKYWGKYGIQLPKNPSISFTLSTCSTETHLEFKPKTGKADTFTFEVFFEGQKAPHFKPKIETYFDRIEEYLPFLKDYDFVIRTSNSFPHSSGIASSASGMAALSACLMQMEKQLNPQVSANYIEKKTSFLARLGSGSAARSIRGPVMIWGAHPEIKNSSDKYAVTPPFSMHSVFENYQDTILLVDKGQKKVSSTLGHNLMNNHPFAEARFKQANDNLMELINILKTGNIESFIPLVESEALTLHSMMMTSTPYFILLKPNTVKIIEKIWKYREATGQSLCFTLDAGANVHLLYPEREKEKTLDFIEHQLAEYCENRHYICDQTGNGCSDL